MNPALRFLTALPPGVRALLVFLTVLGMAGAMGNFSKAYDLHAALALSPPAFWKGQVWQAVTYALLPAGIFDFLMNGFMLAVLGAWVERAWSRRGLWTYCLITAMGTGLAKAVLTPSSNDVLTGTGGVVLGLIAAWVRLCGNGRVQLLGVGEMPVRQTAALVAAATLGLAFATAGLMNALVAFSGALVGWLYLSVRWKFNSSQRSRIVVNERVSRLEL